MAGLRSASAWAFLAFAVLAGCQAPPPAPEPGPPGEAPPAAGSPSATEGPQATGSAAPLAPAAPPPERVKDAGAQWSACTLRSGIFYHRHEAAAPLVPPGYRQVNHVAGNVGANLLMALECSAVSVGNATVFRETSLALYGIRVDPPDAADAQGANYLLLDLAASDEGLAAQLLEAFPAAYVAVVALDGPTYQVEAQAGVPDGMEVRVDELLQQDAERQEAAPLRLHWLAPDGRPCWSDLRHVAEVTGDHDALLQAAGGHPLTVSGGSGRMAGVGIRGVASGGLSPPACAEAA